MTHPAIEAFLSSALTFSMMLNAFLGATILVISISPELKDEVRKLLKRVTAR